ncbi:acyl-CoA oxidase [Nakamurella silvestris]|nr:acyl-CoA oxidase [Nakamurella silvestris]
MTENRTTPDAQLPDARSIHRLLGGRWADLREEFTEQVRRLDFPATEDLSTAQQRAVTLGLLEQVAATGAPRVGFDPAYGGGGDHGASVAIMEVLAQADLSLMVKSGVQWGLFGGAIAALGTDRHLGRYLDPMMKAELLGCFAMTETGHGSDVQRIRTTATFDPATDELVVHSPDPSARKDYIGNAAEHGRMAVVFAQLVVDGRSHGPHAVLVPIRDENGEAAAGVTISDCGRKAGLNGVDNGRLMFDQVRVPRVALLNRYGDIDQSGAYSSPIASSSRRFFTMLGTLVKGRVSVAGCAAAATRKALTIAVRYGDTRRQFASAGTAEESLLLDYPAYQRTLLPALARSYALHFAQEQLLVDMDRILHAGDIGEAVDEVAQRELETRAAGLKAVGTWHASATVAACREACGGAGYLAANQISQLKSDLDVFTTFEGANTVLLQQAGKGLLTHYRQQIGDLDPIGMVSAVAEQILSQVWERTAGVLIQRTRTLGNRESELAATRDHRWQVALFADRADRLLHTLAARIQAASKEGVSPGEIADRTQNHLLRAARAHVERVVLETFVATINGVTDPAVKSLLVQVCDLHALSEIERDASWFLENGRMSGAQSKAVRDSVDQLCAELRPHAGLLVDAFGIPQEWITAPIVAVG